MLNLDITINCARSMPHSFDRKSWITARGVVCAHVVTPFASLIRAASQCGGFARIHKDHFLKIVLLGVTLSSLFIGCGSTRSLSECSPARVVTSPKPGRVLLVAAHQDDDVFIASRLLQHRMQGDTIFVVYTSVSTQVDSIYVNTRVNESLIALRILGVEPSQCHFLRFQDGSTYRSIRAIVDSLNSIVHSISPTTFYVPAYEGGHIDHDVANFALSQVLQRYARDYSAFEYPIYTSYETICLLPFVMRNYDSRIPTYCRALQESEYRFVRKYWEVYESQHFPMGLYFSIYPGNLCTLGIEYFRNLPRHDYFAMPSTGSVAYERYLAATFQDFLDAITTYLDSERKAIQ